MTTGKTFYRRACWQLTANKNVQYQHHTYVLTPPCCSDRTSLFITSFLNFKLHVPHSNCYHKFTSLSEIYVFVLTLVQQAQSSQVITPFSNSKQHLDPQLFIFDFTHDLCHFPVKQTLNFSL